jgi:hypothetical protein
MPAKAAAATSETKAKATGDDNAVVVDVGNSRRTNTRFDRPTDRASESERRRRRRRQRMSHLSSSNQPNLISLAPDDRESF